MFFNKVKAKYNIVNDQDSEVFNLFNVLQDNKEELFKMLLIMPVHQDLWNHWKINKETDPVRRAVRFLMLSNFGYMGKPQTLRYDLDNTKEILLDEIDIAHKFMCGVKFMNCDFRDIFPKISFKDDDGKRTAFIYADPPYLDCDNNYESSFKESDSYDLFEVLQNTEIKWAMSEFDHPFILSEAKRRGLNIIIIGERINMKNRRTEVLITNYTNHPKFNFI